MMARKRKDELLESLNKHTKGWRGLTIVILLALLFLISPYLSRITVDTGPIIGQSPFENMRVAQEISQGQNNFYDEMIEGGKQRMPDPYQYLLSIFVGKVSLVLVSIILPLLSGLISLFIINLIMDRLKVPSLTKIIIMLMTIMSPIFIYTFAVSSRYTLIIPLMLLGIYFFMGKSRISGFLSAIFFLPMPFFGNFETFMSLFLLFIYIITKNDKKPRFVAIFSLLFAISATSNLYIMNNYMHSIAPNFVQSTGFTDIISDFGSKLGMGLFKIMISFIGIIFLWRSKKENRWFLFLFSLIIASVIFFDKKNIIYGSFILAYFAGIGVMTLIKRRWDVHILKTLTLITILSGLLFSTVSYIDTMSSEEPSQEKIDALRWFSLNTDQGTTLSHYSNGAFIQSIGNHRVFMSSDFRFDPILNQRYKVSEDIFSSRNLKKTRVLLEQNNIRYIFIDKNMKEGLVWDEDEEGLLFLLRNKEVFHRIYSEEGIEIYEIIPS